MIATLVERLLGLTGLSKTLIAIGAAVAIAAGAAAVYGVWHHKVYQSGYDRARHCAPTPRRSTALRSSATTGAPAEMPAAVGSDREVPVIRFR